jgi:hypothetical protein
MMPSFRRRLEALAQKIAPTPASAAPAGCRGCGAELTPAALAVFDYVVNADPGPTCPECGVEWPAGVPELIVREVLVEVSGV